VLKDGHGEIEVRFRHFKTGQARWMAYKVLTLTDSAGQPVALATVSQDVTVRKALQDNLRRLAGDLSDADRRKDEFLAILAHELRNPLAVIHNAVQVQLRAAGDAKAVVVKPVDHEDLLKMLERSAADRAVPPYDARHARRPNAVTPSVALVSQPLLRTYQEGAPVTSCSRASRCERGPACPSPWERSPRKNAFRGLLC
jgi:signal transduction histidine kinase